MKKMWFILGVFIIVGIAGFLIFKKFPAFRAPIQRIRNRRTIEKAIAQYGSKAKRRLRPYLQQAGFTDTPGKIALLAFKQEQLVEVWGKQEEDWKHIKTYPFTATSGGPGPKLKEGDGQIPEGIYHVEYLNPNSSYYLSFKVNYPNDFDKAMAEVDSRTQLGGDIFFHGKAATIGCIPVGDDAIEELFILVHDVGRHNIQVIIAPHDFRKNPLRPDIAEITWIPILYDSLERALEVFPVE